MTFDKTEKRTHEYVSNGTVNLIEALDIATGEVTEECYPQRRSEEFLAFMKTVTATYVDRNVHVVVDNLRTHFTTDVRDWHADNPNITFHRNLVGASWINQIEAWFGLITRQAIRRRTFGSVIRLVTRSTITSPTGMPTGSPSHGPLISTQSSPRSIGLSQKSNQHVAISHSEDTPTKRVTVHFPDAVLGLLRPQIRTCTICDTMR
jgi:hypothetical protein